MEKIAEHMESALAFLTVFDKLSQRFRRNKAAFELLQLNRKLTELAFQAIRDVRDVLDERHEHFIELLKQHKSCCESVTSLSELLQQLAARLNELEVKVARLEKPTGKRKPATHKRKSSA